MAMLSLRGDALRLGTVMRRVLCPVGVLPGEMAEGGTLPSGEGGVPHGTPERRIGALGSANPVPAQLQLLPPQPAAALRTLA